MMTLYREEHQDLQLTFSRTKQLTKNYQYTFRIGYLFLYLELRTGKQFTCDELLQTLQDMKVREVLGEGYLPTYTRTDVTDALHDAFGFRTDYQILTKADLKTIVKQTKRKR